MSIRDTYAGKERKENFCYGILLGISELKESRDVSSNEEAGVGYSDIIIRDDRARLAIVIEMKYDEEGNIDAAARRALAQIDAKRYADKLCTGKSVRVIKYGIACCRKECRVAAE